jgi:hypothetical protein
MSVISTRLAAGRLGPLGRSGVWASAILLAVVAMAIVVIPAWLIQPFDAQSPGELALSYQLRRWSPVATVLATGLVIALAVWLWHGARWWGKAILVLAALLCVGTSWLARQNHFEWMFRPMQDVAYAPARDAEWVSDTDVVMAVEINGDAVGYPVRQVAYHHVVQGQVGSVPIVATY